jgi:hypothetical protein
MWEPRPPQSYGPSRPVTGIALPYINTCRSTLVNIQNNRWAFSIVNMWRDRKFPESIKSITFWNRRTAQREVTDRVLFIIVHEALGPKACCGSSNLVLPSSSGSSTASYSLKLVVHDSSGNLSFSLNLLTVPFIICTGSLFLIATF